MEIFIQRLNLHLSASFEAGRAQAIGVLLSEALQAALRTYAAEFAAAPAGYSLPSITMPILRVDANANDDEVAEAVANEIARSVLRGLEVR